MSCLAPLYPPANSGRSTHTHSLLCRLMACPEPPDPGVCHLVRPARPAPQHCGQKEQTGTSSGEVGRHGCQRWKCREALFSALLLLSDLTPVPGSRKTCPSRCLKSCHSKSVMISVSLKSVASSSSMTSSAAPVAHAGCTHRRPGRRDSGGALPVRWSVGYPDRPRMPTAGLRRPPSRSARTTWPLWGSSLRAPSVAGDLPPPHRQTGFPQPVATLLPPNRA
jgi:hypothetical protein